jgi:phosphoribosylformimino-5-aminoimidazole carboxamide ribotide isomerase
MIIFPAVDIQKGKAVRLRQGRVGASTVFASDPVEAARLWVERGALWLHVVDLDGAFDGADKSRIIVQNICRTVAVPIQLGGGIRSADTARAYLDAGVTRLIIGTVALEEPAIFAALCNAFPGKIGVSLDAEAGRLKSRGWVSDTGLVVDDVLSRLVNDGASFIIYTDIERDGMKSGVDLVALTHLAEASGIPVIAAGGVSTLADVQKLYPLTLNTRLVGAVSGQALYEGTLDLAEANSWITARSECLAPPARGRRRRRARVKNSSPVPTIY